MERTFSTEADEAKQAMENAYVLWTLADPLFEEERWLTYQACVQRYNALVAAANGRTEVREVRLPWVTHAATQAQKLHVV